MDVERALRESGIPKDLYLELIGDFVIQLQESIKKLEVALGDGDFKGIADIAHFLKSSAGTLATEEVMNILNDIEIAAEENKQKDIFEEKLCLLRERLGELRAIV